MKLAFDKGGDGGKLLVLLHGLGANRCVWRAMLSASRWDGRWMALDLRGHGGSAHAASYALEDHAADVVETIGAGWDEITVLGHSMGGAVGLKLAGGTKLARVFGLGIKVAWDAQELAGLERMAAASVKWFATRDEAAARYLKVAGLAASDDSCVGPGIVQGESGWRLAADPATARVGPPPMRALIETARCPFHLARGAGDRMVSLEQLQEYDSEALDIPDAGHNAMVDRPGDVWDWVL
ncbi:MAG: alpha/beta hydrolase [Alphaproteobacteria bacterium]|nr:alpha/beta hydrolase [Alphaproteobacteria bacterium]